ncbi:uncharacterized protein LOC123713581 isoform X1 [Pieris brassicae]|uniref:uncharacterized protein LOC123713581 isoform X1 n=1 Tax=Pieris brassicae TaxID=7116 RepID=UPI001E65F6D0|nr:uncharacterized protein LOC123713581 isoform X1 [Pieris brassicae]
MPEIPDCLARRYQALDELIKELTRNKSGSNINCCSDDPGVKMMCNFWNILKENPDCDLKKAVEERMGITSTSTGIFPQRCREVTCYMAGCCKRDGEGIEPPKAARVTSCCKSGQNTDPKPQICQRCSTPSTGSDTMPLSKVLCNIKEAASFDKKCQAKVSELLTTQKELQEQIGILEQREKEGLQLLKQADCMWTCMEASYKKKVADSLERQKALLNQMKEIEGSVQKWRKNKKELEFEMGNIDKCQQEIREKTTEKNSDINCINLEIADFHKRIENNKGDVEATNKSFSSKRSASCAKQSYIASEVSKLEKLVNEEKRRKKAKEDEGSKYIKDAREDLQRLCKVLLQKKLENEDMSAEKEALQLEIEMLNQTCDQCKDKCRNKQQNIEDEILAIDKEIANFKVRCIRCHECTDTMDMRKFCSDCPRCAEERDCLLEGDHCIPDHTMDCVCMTVKQKFLDNVFENMYTVLERQTRTGPGKAVAEAVMSSLKKSRNGKLNEATRKILQDFILNTVKKNLNLTIVGGAVKTRCEMDSETYNQLMLCLKQIKVTKPAKADKGTPTKKDPCRRWPNSSECNCPNGPKECICSRKAPPAAKDPPCQPDLDDEDAGEEIVCPHRDNAPCGPDCGAHTPSRVAAEVAAWKPNPCQGPSCQLKNMRAAQCVLGPEALCSKANLRNKSYAPIVPSIHSLGKSCQCSHISRKAGTYHKDTKQLKRKNICDKEISTVLQFPFSDKKVVFSDEDLIYEIEHIVSTKALARNKSESISSFLTKKRSVIIIDNTKKTENILKIDKEKPKNKNESSVNTSNNKKHGTSDKDIQALSEEQNLNVVIHDSDNELKCVAPKLTKTPSGNLTMALEENIVQLINSKVKENVDLYINLREDDSGSYSIDFSCSDLDKNAKKLLVKRTPSGNLLLDIKDKKKNSQSLKNNKANRPSKLSKSKSFKSKKVRKLPPKEIVDSFTETSTLSSKCSDKFKSELCKATLKGLKRFINEPIILRRTASGNYDIIIDKEFENWYKDAVKCHEGEEDTTCVKVLEKSSGNCIISFIDEEDTAYKNACISKDYCGNLKLVINSNVKQSLLQKQSSIVSSKIFEKILNRETVDKEKRKSSTVKKRFMQYKSCSDSNIYNDLRNNLFSQFSSGTSAKLTKTKSGQYTVVLNKESRNSLLTNLRKYFCGSTKGSIPINRDDNGEISIVLNNRSNQAEYASLTISPSGSIYVKVKDNKKDNKKDSKKDNKKDQIDISTKLSSHCDIRWDQFIDDVKNPSVKGISTHCHDRDDGNCDINKCVCKNLCFKSKRWVIDADSSTECGVVWKRDSNRYSALDLKDNQCNGTIINRHIVIKPRHEEKPRNDVYEHYNCYLNNVCPYHVSRYGRLSNELLEISGMCPTGQFEGHPCVKEQLTFLNTIQKPNDLDTSKATKVYNWDSIDFLPHQLPTFLKDFTRTS